MAEESEYSGEYKQIIGKKVLVVQRDDDSFHLIFEDGTAKFYHDQDCCESVYIHTVEGDLKDLVGKVIIDIEEFIGDEHAPDGAEIPELVYSDDSHTWTKYVIKAGGVEFVMYWFGQSNGYYSESVNFFFDKN